MGAAEGVAAAAPGPLAVTWLAGCSRTPVSSSPSASRPCPLLQRPSPFLCRSTWPLRHCYGRRQGDEQNPGLRSMSPSMTLGWFGNFPVGNFHRLMCWHTPILVVSFGGVG